jgi:anti-sigma regulatory factor (Ser/Thr protein kinase)
VENSAAIGSPASALVAIGAVARELGVSTSRVRQLTDDGTFAAVRTAGGHRRYDLGQVRAAWEARAHRRTRPVSAAEGPAALLSARTTVLALPGLDEDQVWRTLAPDLEIDDHPSARAVAHYAFTEMLNNAIDHSAGTKVSIEVRTTPKSLVVEISDDGIGAFRRLAEGKQLPDLHAAIEQLSKGKQTTAAEQHSGEGIFFTSKAVNVFTLMANGLVWTVDNDRHDQAVGNTAPSLGTSVRFTIHRTTTLDLGELFRRFTDDTRFVRTAPVVKLFERGDTFVSRSEAKRLAVDLEHFTEVEIDFTGVTMVGQAFVDQLFRVWATAHPSTRLIPTHMNDAVEFMVTRGLPAASPSSPSKQNDDGPHPEG